jgi:SAM-dependent methyltransferase
MGVGGTIPWVCPLCRGSLLTGFDRWSCRTCRATFDAYRGIPDLRTRDDVYLGNDADRTFARRLLDDFDRLDFRGLLERYFDLEPSVPADLRRRQVDHIVTAPGRVRGWLDAMGEPPSGGLLDLGCGSGSFLASVGQELPAACGVDIALRWLLVARKRLDEEGLGHLPLVCACAEDLPVAGSTFSAVIAGDAIEHVGDQAATLAEAYRVLKPGGRLFLAAPNRFSLAPEPHVQIWGVGFLPRRWMPTYVRCVRKIDFRAIRTLGYGEWKDLLRASPFASGRISIPPLPEGDLRPFGLLKRVVARLYNAVVATRVGQWVGRAVGPLFHVVCEKSGTETPLPPVRATRQRSRPSAARR